MHEDIQEELRVRWSDALCQIFITHLYNLS